MNKIELINKTTCYLTICKLLKALNGVDLIKLCLLTLLNSRPIKKSYKCINDLFQEFAFILCCNKNEMTDVADEIVFLEKNGIVRIKDNIVFLAINTDVDYSDLFYDEIELFRQINNLNKNSFVRFIVQYV